MATYPTGVELVRAAMKATGASTSTQLAKALDLRGYSAPRNVKRWLEGVNDPDFESTLQLLDAAGWLTIGGSSNANPGPALDRDAVAAALEELADLQERQDAVLERLLGHATEQAPPRGGRRKRAG